MKDFPLVHTAGAQDPKQHLSGTNGQNPIDQISHPAEDNHHQKSHGEDAVGALQQRIHNHCLQIGPSVHITDQPHLLLIHPAVEFSPVPGVLRLHPHLIGHRPPLGHKGVYGRHHHGPQLSAHAAVGITFQHRGHIARPVGEEVHDLALCLVLPSVAVGDHVPHPIAADIPKILGRQHAVGLQGQFVQVFIIMFFRQARRHFRALPELLGMNAHENHVLASVSLQLHIRLRVIDHLCIRRNPLQSGIFVKVRLIISKLCLRLPVHKAGVVLPDLLDDIVRPVQIGPILQSVLQNGSGGGGVKHAQRDGHDQKDHDELLFSAVFVVLHKGDIAGRPPEPPP